MKKPIPDRSGLALTRLLYGDFERGSARNISRSRTANKYERFEAAKHRLPPDLSPSEYEREIQRLAKKYEV